jgi:hypothetical protein
MGAAAFNAQKLPRKSRFAEARGEPVSLLRERRNQGEGAA